MTSTTAAAPLCPACRIRDRILDSDPFGGESDSSSTYLGYCGSCLPIADSAPFCFDPGCLNRRGPARTRFANRFDHHNQPLYHCDRGHFDPMTKQQIAAAAGCYLGRADARTAAADPVHRQLVEARLSGYSAFVDHPDTETRYFAQGYMASLLAGSDTRIGAPGTAETVEPERKRAPMSTEHFDADTEHPWALRYRIPRLPSPYLQRWRYEVVLTVPSADRPENLYGAIEPSEDEARVIGSYIAYRRSCYGERQAAKLQRPFDTDSTTNTVFLIKTAGGWQFRFYTFREGPWPLRNDPRRAEFPPTREGLLALLDHINDHATSWQRWKTEHPELAAAPAGAPQE